MMDVNLRRRFQIWLLYVLASNAVWHDELSATETGVRDECKCV